MNWYKKAQESAAPQVSTTMSEEVSVTPRQIYTRDDVIQEREDLAPSRLERLRRLQKLRKVKKKKRN